MRYNKIKTISCLSLFFYATSPMIAQENLPADSTKVTVAYNQVGANDLLGGVSYLNVSELMEKNDMTSSGISRKALLPGLNGNVWGNEGLVIIDGMPRDLGNITASEIEQITVLKGAAAVALYGSQGVKGVTLVTTKRGKANKNVMNIRGSYGLNIPKEYAEYLGSADYMTLYNEARANDRLDALYNNSTIANYASGANPFRYPNVDYYSSDFLRKSTYRGDVTGEFSGGNDRTQYYINLGYYQTNSLLNIGNGKDEKFSRFYVRGNLDMRINSFITAKVNSSIVNYNTKTAAGANYWSEAAKLRPNWFTPLVPIDRFDSSNGTLSQIVEQSPFIVDGKYLLGGTQQQMTNPFAFLYTQGLQNYTVRQYQIDATLNFDLGKLLPGLALSTQLGVDYYGRQYLNEDKNDYAVYDPIWGTIVSEDGVEREMIIGLNKYNEDKVSKSREMKDSYSYQKLLFNGALTYNQTFDHVHNVRGLLLASAYQQTIGEEESASSTDLAKSYHKPSNANIGLQLAYNYDHKYYVDFTSAVVHSAKMAPGKRNAFSPTVSAGWRISDEEFMKNLKFINNLKITASAGILNTDSDIADYYTYSAVYTNGGNHSFASSTSAPYTTITRPESDFGFIKRKEMNIGLEATLFNRLLDVNVQWYNIRMNGMLLRDSNMYPNYMSYGNTNMIPWTNFNDNSYSGLDFSVKANKSFGKLDLSLGVIGTYSVGEATTRSENYAFGYQSRIGRPLSAIWGLEADGLFMNQAEIDGAPTQTYGAVQAGDIKYKDQNGDNRIDSEDEVYLGRADASFLYGINLTAKWNNFTLFMLFEGQAGGNAIKSDDYYRPGLERKFSTIANDRTQLGIDNNGDFYVTKLGTYPRLSTNNTNNNFRNSTYWMYSTDFLKLAQVQLSYTLPKNLFENKFVKGVGVYLRGENLLTIAKERKILETNIGSTPQNRYVSLGATVTL